MKIGVMLRNLNERGGIVVYTVHLLNSLLSLDQKNEYVLFYRDPGHLGRFSSFPNVSERIVHSANKLWWDQIAVPRAAKRENVDVIFNPKLSIPLLSPKKTVLVISEQ